MIWELKLLKSREGSTTLVPLVCSGRLVRVISKKVAADIIKAMSNLITSAVIVCNCAPDITPYTAANWLITWGYWTKLVASPSGRQSQAACPADCSTGFIQWIFLWFDCRSSRCTAQRDWSKQKVAAISSKNPKPECQSTYSDVDRSINKRQKISQEVAGSWRNALWAHTWQRVHPTNKGIWGGSRSFSCCCCTCMSSTRQNSSINKREIFLNWFPEPETENSDAIQTFEETFQYRSMVNWLEFCINLNLLYFCVCFIFFFI